MDVPEGRGYMCICPNLVSASLDETIYVSGVAHYRAQTQKDRNLDISSIDYG